MLKYLNGEKRLPFVSQLSGSQQLAILITVGVVFYIGWIIGQSAGQVLQFTFNGLSVGAIYALLAMGFTMVYGCVWFFDLSFGAMAAMGAYGVFYLRSEEALQVGQFEVNEVYLNIVMGAVVAGVMGWALYTLFYRRLRGQINSSALLVVGGLFTLGAGVYAGLVLAYPDDLNVWLSPLIGVMVAGAAGWALYQGYHRALGGASNLTPLLALAGVGTLALGAYCGLLVARTSGSSLYLSWAVSCLLVGAVGLSLYRGLYMYMRRRASSPLVMLVASLGILLAVTAFLTIIFQSAPRPLPEAFGSDPWTIGGANIKHFNVFTIGVAVTVFLGLIFLLKKTNFGKAVRAISDDEEVAKVVGINTTALIAIIFFIGAAIAALAGLLNGHDTAIQTKMGLLLLLKGWVASVVGGIGNIYGAIVGGFVLGLIENYGIWYLAGEWKDAITFILLILFLAFWPKGLLPRK